jgi:hypothetical protein
VSVNGKYPEQLIAMVTPEMKADIRAEADERGVSISQVVREAREIAVWARQPQRIALGAGMSVAQDDGNTFLVNGRPRDVSPDTLAAYAAGLEPDTEPDEVDGSLADQDARVARLKARGLL